MKHVIKVTVYLVHIAKDFELMNEVYEEVCGRDTRRSH